MKKELRILLTAVMFFTKIPVPKWVDHSPEYLNDSARYFSVVGIIIGGAGASVFLGFQLILPQSLSVLLSILATIWLTGAFHEDGLADMFDGFGGGWTKDKILEIMQDSRIGTFGVVGVTGVLALKFVSLHEMNATMIPAALVSGHALSRFLSTTLLITHKHVRSGLSKAKPVAQTISTLSVVLSALFGVLPLLLFQNYWIMLAIVPPILVRWYLGYYFKKWIGGHTGDCSGATQQLTEVTFYLSLPMLWKFI